AFTSPELLNAKITKALRAEKNELWLSPISVWEIAILTERGRIVLDSPYREWITRALVQVPFTEAPLNHEAALLSRTVELPHQDPADRFLVATALVYELTLVTADKMLLESKSARMLSNL
ncbi:MAG: type II toxin-antitoxin system VapC family toxin, partial [Pseudomonadales bacterium]